MSEPTDEILKRARGLLDEFKGREAFAILAPLAGSHADDPVYLELWGDANHQCGQYIAAMNAYWELMQIQPSRASVYHKHGDVHCALGFKDGAATMYRAAVMLDAENVAFRISLARVQSELGRIEECFKTLRDGLSLAPEWRLYRELASAHERVGDPENAEAAYLKAVELLPADAGIGGLTLHSSLGDLYRTTRQYDKAVKSYETGLQFSDGGITVLRDLLKKFLDHARGLLAQWN